MLIRPLPDAKPYLIAIELTDSVFLTSATASSTPSSRMGRIIRGQRKGAGSIFTSNTSKRKGEAKHRQSVRTRLRPPIAGSTLCTASGGFSPPEDASDAASRVGRRLSTAFL